MTLLGKTLIIVNPIAGGGHSAKVWPDINARLAAQGLAFDAVMTEAPGHAIRLARAAGEQGYRVIVSVGGDGTLNEIVNGVLADQAEGCPDITVAVIPVGTGGDFVRTLGVPRTWMGACEHLFDERTRIVDVGRMEFASARGDEQRYFVNVAGLGFDGEVTARTSTASKRLGGTLPYFSSLLLTLVGYSNKDVTVDLDHEAMPGRLNSVIVANGAWFGGGMFIAPDARPDDGLFDVVTIGDVGKLELLQTMPRVYKGTHLTHPKLRVYRARAVRVDSKQEMWLQADGEALGRAPVTFNIRPAAIRIKI
jgi:diacylglycerol kinase (ATP)